MTIKKALILAIDQYQSQPLSGCTNDGRRLAKLLAKDNFGFDIHSAFDEEVTRAKFTEQLEWLCSGADIAVLFFAGHGWRRPTGTYLVTHDSRVHDEGIELSWLANALKRMMPPQATAVLIFDACHSGDGIVRSSEKSDDMVVEDLRMLSGTSRVLLAACKGSEFAMEFNYEGVAHGAFSHYLCSALEGHAASQDGTVTVNSAFDYLASKLREEGRQTPVLRGHQEGQIVLGIGVKKVGGWKSIQGSHLSEEEAIEKGGQLLSAAQEMMQVDSFATWQSEGFAAAARAFEPTLRWFKSRANAQSELIKNRDFKNLFDSCTHLHKQLCAPSPGVITTNGKLVENIGGGSFGNVWRVEGGNWASAVCFKSYHAHEILDVQKESRFRRGYQAMLQLDHPNIVKVRELTEVPFGFYMDFIEGANIRQLNPGATFEPEALVKLLLQVAETLKHAHGKGVVHRDVKPENIVVKISDENEYTPFLTDFDLAWFSAATQVTKLADGFGSHFYAAPEQINSPQSSAAHKPTVDIYSFGQLFFFCVCGRDPMAFNKPANVHALKDALSRRWNDARAASDMLQLFSDCADISAANRIQDFREICERLAKLELALTSKIISYSFEQFLEQLSYLLTGKVVDSDTKNSSMLRSRSNRTGFSIQIAKESNESCAIDVEFHPDSLLMGGKKASDVRSVVNSRVDTMLQEYKKEHDVVRRGKSVGAFEFSVRIDRLKKDSSGVLAAKNIISQTIDILEQA